jgi:hypothetical protein
VLEGSIRLSNDLLRTPLSSKYLKTRQGGGNDDYRI